MLIYIYILDVFMIQLRDVLNIKNNNVQSVDTL